MFMRENYPPFDFLDRRAGSQRRPGQALIQRPPTSAAA